MCLLPRAYFFLLKGAATAGFFIIIDRYKAAKQPEGIISEKEKEQEKTPIAISHGRSQRGCRHLAPARRHDSMDRLTACSMAAVEAFGSHGHTCQNKCVGFISWSHSSMPTLRCPGATTLVYDLPRHASVVQVHRNARAVRAPAAQGGEGPLPSTRRRQAGWKDRGGGGC